ncbi:SDR family oxidoreductase [Sphingomonas segetis]|jgi:NAD(P)-dependent dehydrogenase (short-subunit alcohol dehydrogenase family)|uniref:SDR family oxidoreductase n=1 Tax=Sphingomonas segetis TaxID=1104779 RepID=UPI0012D30B21|nr:SDR family oxidoreductase [Sphingomonas segetis]
MDIKGAAAVVTGAASGLGEATARALAGHGAKVAIFDRDGERGSRVANEIGGVFCEVDVTSDEKVAQAFAKARQEHGQERILVNCAGVATATKTVARDKETKAAKLYPLQQFEMTLQINLIGTFRCIAHSAHGMVDLDPLADGEKGVIINTASVAAEDGQIGQAAYSASKGGVLAMALPIARDLMNEGVRVNTILPGVFKTPMVAMMPPNVQDALGAQVPFPKRLGQPEEYANLACFLIESRYMNAAAVRLDGGIRMAPR